MISEIPVPSRQSPGDLGGFPGNPSVLEGIGEAGQGTLERRASFMFSRSIALRPCGSARRHFGVVQLLSGSEGS